MVFDLIFIFLASLTSALIAEGLSWLLIYRTEDYQKLKITIDKLQKKVDKKKDNSETNKNKKLERYEETLKNSNQAMGMVRMKSMFAVGIILISFVGFLNSSYDGYIVAKLPFEPIGLFTGISHRGISGNDYTDCSMIFIYILSSMAIRSNLQKFFGFTPPPSSKNMFGVS